MIVPKEWLDNPQKLRGAVISTVVGDGDWVIVVNYTGHFATGFFNKKIYNTIL